MLSLPIAHQHVRAIAACFDLQIGQEAVEGGERLIIGLCGDGSFAMSAGDLATVTRVGGPTILILFNNGCYGWIKMLQKLHHGSRYFSVDFTEPLNYNQIAEGFGLRVLEVNSTDEIAPAIKRALNFGAPCFIELITPGESEVIPPVAQWQRMAMS